MTEDSYVEPAHPKTGEALTDLDRALLKMHFVAVEISVLLQAIRMPILPAVYPPPDLSSKMLFVLGNQATLLVWKFTEIFRTMQRETSTMKRMIRARQIIAPLYDRIKSWPGLESYRNTAIAHPYLTKSENGAFIHPVHFINKGVTPAHIPESLLLAACAYYSLGAIITVFNQEYVDLDGLFRLGKIDLDGRGVRTGEEIGRTLAPLVEQCKRNLTDSGYPLGGIEQFHSRVTT